jgi:hypothetical protein
LLITSDISIHYFSARRAMRWFETISVSGVLSNELLNAYYPILLAVDLFPT